MDRPTENRWQTWLALLVITLLAFALRWYYVHTAIVIGPVRGDATQYFAYAWNLAHHGIFSRDVPDAPTFHPDNFRDPGYPAFLALWMKVWEPGEAWYAAVLFCQALLGALTVTMATQLGRYWLPERWAIAAGVLMAVWPHSITINGYLLTETLFGFLCVLALLLCARAYRHGSTRWAAAGGFAMGAAALTNAVLLPFGVLLAGFLAWRHLAPRKVCVALAMGALMLPGAWALRNTTIPAPDPSNSSMGRALLNFTQGAWPNFHGAYRDSFLGDAPKQVRAHKLLQAVDNEYDLLLARPGVGARAIAHRFTQHPLRYAAWYLFDKPQELWGWGIVIGQGDLFVYPTRDAPFQTSRPWMALAAICHAFNPLLLLLALGSLPVIWWRQRNSRTRMPEANRMLETNQMPLISVACIFSFATLVYVVLQAEPRYSIPFRPFELLLAVTTLCALCTWLQQKRAARHSSTL